MKESGFTGHINLFGFFPTLAWRAILEEETAIDSIAIGEFEDILTSLAEHLGSGKELSTIPGLAVRKQDGTPLLKKAGNGL